MYKGSDILGKPIVAYDSGEKFGRVKDLIFDQDSNQLLALLINEGGWFSDALVIPYQGIQAIGIDAVIVPSETAAVRVGQIPEVKRILAQNNVLKGTHIMTTDGRNLGRMIDLYFDEQTGVIEGYEVSGGLFADAYSGRSFVPAPHTLKIGEQIAFVPSEIADLMEEQIGGIKAAMLTASEKIQVAAQETGRQLQDAQRTAAVSLTNTIIDPSEQKAFVVGRTAQEDVLTPDGSTLVRVGQSITLLNAEQAEELRILDKLYRAAGGNVRQRVSEKLQATAQDTNTRFQSATGQASQKLEDTRRSATASFTNAVVNPTQQKAFAIGKTPEWTVTAAGGTKVAISGQVVTPLIAENAEQLGVLDELYRATGGRLRNQITSRADSAVAGSVVEETRGRRVQQTVRARSGFIVAAPGQIVTDTVIERAKLYHVERELLNAVGLSTSAALRYRTNSTAFAMNSRFDSTSTRFAQGTAQVKIGARNLWEQMKQAAGDLQDRSARTLEEQRIKGAVGRPVTRVILNENDEIILNVGDLITHQAIEAARLAGVLDVLLSSVYTQSPEFSKAEMSAPEHGKASLTAN
ncbi:PRC-barrel domain-containing protein [Phormidium tenue FACHB-886]|nr:PRC-barrel domain-containing protein [Phormidium tenue FACHB-886]